MGLADRVIAVSKAVKNSMVQRGISEEKLRVICNGTLGSPRTRKISDYQPLTLDRPAIVTVAGMYKRKGIAELIAAFEEVAQNFPTVNLYLVEMDQINKYLKLKLKQRPLVIKFILSDFGPNHNVIY
jgi:glycosyltransferase involved in cell wall biosynthesis